MARTPKTSEVIDLNDTSIDQPKVAGAMELMRTEAASTELALTEQNERVTALAQKLGYQGSTDLGALENSARDANEYLGKSIYALGSCLLLLKEGSPRGQFLPTLERLGLSADSAQRYMAMSRRFANTATSRHLEKLGFSKMTELLPLDDDQIEELSGLGQTGELALDDVATMSVKQLREAVRKERQESTKQKNRAERQESVITELHEEVRMIKLLPPDEELARIQKEAVELQAEAQGLVKGTYRQALIALNNCEQDQQLFMAGMVGQLMAELVMLRDEFSLPDMGGKPEWERWAEAQETATTKTKAKAN